MKQMVSDIVYDQISQQIVACTGLHFPPRKYRTLQKGIAAAAAELGYSDVRTFVNQLRSGIPSRHTINTMVKYLTIGETFFLRDKYLFQVLKEDIFRGMLYHSRRAEKRIRIWSAGCATGEEPYSIAILIDQMASLFKDWEVEIIGTDVNPDSLKKAEAGVYSRWSFRETPDAILKKYFTAKAEGTFELVAQIKNRVRFYQVNFADAVYAPALTAEPMDIILCRNVIMYFESKARDRVIRQLTDHLAQNGWLIVGPAETSFVNVGGLTPVRFPNAILHRKGPPRRSERSNGAAPKMESGDRVFPSRRIESDGPTHRRYQRRKTDIISRQRPRHDIYQEAMILYQSGRYREAISSLSELITESHTASSQFLMTPEAMTLVAKAHANLGEIEKAEYWCRSAIGTEKLNPENYYLLATIYQEGGHLADAIKSIKQALYLDPEFIMAHFTHGILLQQSGRSFEAKKAFGNARLLLSIMNPGETVPYSEGITAGRFMETLEKMR